MRFRWPLKVDRLAKRLCSSPMSASTAEKGGSRAGGVAGTGNPAFAISAASPNACKAPPKHSLAALSQKSGNASDLVTEPSLATGTERPNAWRAAVKGSPAAGSSSV